MRTASILIVLVCTAEMLGMLGSFSVAALLPQFIELWGLTNTQAGWINGIYYGAYAVAVPVLGSATDRIDGRSIYIGSALLTAVSSLLFAWFADGFVSALLLRTLAGIGLAGTYIPGLKALVDRLEPDRRSRGISFYTAAFSLGTSTSFLISGKVSILWGWEMAFYIAAVGSLVAAILVGLLKPHTPQGDPRARRNLGFNRLTAIFANRRSMAFVLGYAAHMWELFAFRSWLVAFLAFSLTLDGQANQNLAPSDVAALVALVAMGASIAGEEFANRFGRIRVLTVIMLSSALVGFSVGFSAGLPYGVVVSLCVLYALLVQADSAALHAGTILNAEPSDQGTTMAVQSFLGFAVAFISPIVFGWVLDIAPSQLSWGLAFATAALVVALGPLIIRLMLKGDADPVK